MEQNFDPNMVTSNSEMSYIPEVPAKMDIDDNLTPPLPPSNPPFQPPLPVGPHPSDIAANSKKFTYPCRDYTNGYCKRGTDCKFSHQVDYSVLVFCHDYQNKKCMRPHCKFLHCYREEETEYIKTGKIPIAAIEMCMKNRKPVCAEFAAGKCPFTAADCEFRHVLENKKEKKPNTFPSTTVPPPPPQAPAPSMSVPPPPGPPPPHPALNHLSELPPHIPPPMIYTQAPPIPPTSSTQGVPMQPTDPQSVLQSRDISPVAHLSGSISQIPSDLSTQTKSPQVPNKKLHIISDIQSGVPPPCLPLSQKECERKVNGETLAKIMNNSKNDFGREKEKSVILANEINQYYLLERELGKVCNINNAKNTQNDSNNLLQFVRKNNETNIGNTGQSMQMELSNEALKELINKHQMNNMNLNQTSGDNHQNIMVQLNQNAQQNSMTSLSQMNQISNLIQQQPMVTQRLVSNNMPQTQIINTGNPQQIYSNERQQQSQQFLPNDWKQQYLANERQQIISQASNDVVNQIMNTGTAQQQFMRSASMTNPQEMIDAIINSNNQHNVANTPMQSMQSGPITSRF